MGVLFFHATKTVEIENIYDELFGGFQNTSPVDSLIVTHQSKKIYNYVQDE